MSRLHGFQSFQAGENCTYVLQLLLASIGCGIVRNLLLHATESSAWERELATEECRTWLL